MQSHGSSNSEPTFWSTYIYDSIPSKYLNGKILELGARDGTPQLQSKHSEKFSSPDYLGVDLIVPEKSKINVIEANALEYDYGEEEWDTFLSVATLEHIDFFEWENLFLKWKEALKPGGHIIILTPHKESPHDFYSSPDYHTNVLQSKEYGKWVGHRVFGIDENLYKKIIGDLVYVKKWTRLPFREDGKSRIWGTLRLIKRFVTGHPYVWNWIKKPRLIIMVVYQKPIGT